MCISSFLFNSLMHRGHQYGHYRESAQVIPKARRRIENSTKREHPCTKEGLSQSQGHVSTESEYGVRKHTWVFYNIVIFKRYYI